MTSGYFNVILFHENKPKLTISEHKMIEQLRQGRIFSRRGGFSKKKFENFVDFFLGRPN